MRQGKVLKIQSQHSLHQVDAGGVDWNAAFVAVPFLLAIVAILASILTTSFMYISGDTSAKHKGAKQDASGLAEPAYKYICIKCSQCSWSGWYLLSIVWK
jgi:hypothetical protein